MESIKRLLYIYCKDCNNNVVETPNYYGLCSECKTDTLNKQHIITLDKVKSFLHTCNDERKDEILAELLIYNNCLPKELR